MSMVCQSLYRVRNHVFAQMLSQHSLWSDFIVLLRQRGQGMKRSDPGPAERLSCEALETSGCLHPVRCYANHVFFPLNIHVLFASLQKTAARRKNSPQARCPRWRSCKHTGTKVARKRSLALVVDSKTRYSCGVSQVCFCDRCMFHPVTFSKRR